MLNFVSFIDNETRNIRVRQHSFEREHFFYFHKMYFVVQERSFWKMHVLYCGMLSRACVNVLAGLEHG